MRMRLNGLLLALVIVAGCSTREYRVRPSNLAYRVERERLALQETPTPATTPYDGAERLRPVYVEGFKRGWEIAVKYWLGSMVGTPEIYSDSPQMAKAWREGLNAGQLALCDYFYGTRR